MELKRALRLSECPSLAFVGAGGKTTTMFQVARQLGIPLIVCATTHLALAQTRLADQHLIFHSLADTNQLAEIALSGVILLTGPVEGTRTTGISPEIVIWLRQFCGYHSLPLLIEADGARQLPLKAPAEHEPALSPEVDTVVVVAGLTGVGRILTAEHVHRPELFAALSGLPIGAQITPQALTRVLLHPAGGLKNIPPETRRVVLLNQADTPTKQAVARSMAAELLRAYDAALIGSLQTSPGNIYAVHEPIAGVILAAGAAQRFGQPKQLLKWRGNPLVWHVAQAALEAGLSPVVVVGGEHTPQLHRVLAGLPVELVHNPHWQAGQRTSVQRGLAAVSARGAATLFLLADQPQVSVPLVRSLMDVHARRRPAIVGPLVDGQRSNPVLFDRVTYATFATLSGDQGARQLFSRFPVEWIPWYDDTLALDIDTPEDFQRLQQTFGG
ncbi:MAG: putative selenium-dependent hydroxylase accessory protein YqeC [Anaerolineales bacterium]|nr:putative selenium-dependent hydroxylase accessory protein YqeC [Anaerolineales bacterium]